MVILTALQTSISDCAWGWGWEVGSSLPLPRAGWWGRQDRNSSVQIPDTLGTHDPGIPPGLLAAVT